MSENPHCRKLKKAKPFCGILCILMYEIIFIQNGREEQATKPILRTSVMTGFLVFQDKEECHQEALHARNSFLAAL